MVATRVEPKDLMSEISVMGIRSTTLGEELSSRWLRLFSLLRKTPKKDDMKSRAGMAENIHRRVLGTWREEPLLTCTTDGDEVGMTDAVFVCDDT
jgi:hypothetical protein